VNDVWLALIALGVLVMAGVQVAAAVFAARAASRIERLANRLEADIGPVVASLQSLSADAARVTALAAAQVERADRLFADLAKKVEQTFDFSFLSGLKAVFTAFRDLRDAQRKRGSTVEDEDALFIG
jgi:hypothetical protein